MRHSPSMPDEGIDSWKTDLELNHLLNPQTAFHNHRLEYIELFTKSETVSKTVRCFDSL